jgi:hypothetical protein
VIRIRYKDFAAGTHDVTGLYGRAERGPRGVTVYLLPGLSDRQRRAVFRRLRQEASRGLGPALPLPQLAIAVGLDRVWTAARIARATVRLHPAVTLVPGAFVVAMMTLFVITSGDQTGIAPSTRGGFAEAAAASGSVAPVVTAGPTRVRMAQVTATEGAEGTTAAGGTGLGSGQRAPTKQAHGKQPKGNQGKPARARARPAAWYVCSQAPGARTPRPRNAQLACRLASRAVPHTAHRPGPPDFAW